MNNQLSSPAGEASTNVVAPSSLPAATKAPETKPSTEVAPDVAAQEADKPEQNDKLAARFAALSRKEKAILEKERAIKEEAKQVEQLRSLEKMLREDPVAFLEKTGMSFDDFASLYVKKVHNEPDSLEDRFNSLAEKIAQYEKQAEEQAAKKEQAYIEAQVTAFKESITSHAKADTDKYELINAEGAYDEVFEVVQKYWEETGKVLAIDKACEVVEEHLESEAKKLLSLKKLQAKEAAQSKDPKATAGKPAPTITNAMTASGVVEAKKPENLSYEESLKRAASLLKWK